MSLQVFKSGEKSLAPMTLEAFLLLGRGLLSVEPRVFWRAINVLHDAIFAQQPLSFLAYVLIR